MESNLKPQVDTHQISLDLEGLGEFLELNSAEVETVTAEPIEIEAPDTSETKLMLRLLQEVIDVNASVEAARQRLAAANERMDSLNTVVQLQTNKLEMLSHYQQQAARVSVLEREIESLKVENAQLRQVWWRRVFSWFKQ